MILQTTKLSELTEETIIGLNKVVASAFGHQGDPSQMLEDTKQHLASADAVQIMTEHEAPIALAMYRSCLWWYSN
jgi:hypothetical protein